MRETFAVISAEVTKVCCVAVVLLYADVDSHRKCGIFPVVETVVHSARRSPVYGSCLSGRAFLPKEWCDPHRCNGGPSRRGSAHAAEKLTACGRVILRIVLSDFRFVIFHLVAPSKR